MAGLLPVHNSALIGFLHEGGLEKLENSSDEEYACEIKFTVYGLMVMAEFQKCKYIVESLHSCYPERYAKPVVRPLLNVDWNEFLRKERRSRGGALWTLKTGVAVYCNDEFMGDDLVLSKYVSSRYILPMKNFYQMGRVALKNYLTEMMAHGRRCIYLMVAINDIIVGTMIFTLFEDMVPKTCRVFLKRCRKLKGGYSNTPIHRIVESSWVQCGGYKLKEVKMPCENFAISHDNRGILSMCNSGRHKQNTTQFLITLQKSVWMDTHYVAFGQLLHGDWVLAQIESVPTKYQAPQKEVKIVRAGEFNLSQPKLGEGRLERELNEFLDERLSNPAYKNYYAKTDLSLEKCEVRRKSGEIQKEFLDSDLRSYFPMEMLPRNIQEAFNYVPGKKSSCVFEVENCLKCGCSHDVGKCLKELHACPSKESIE
ncbi:probable inactive peptidyl-prolyl cis-trans isomerase-like 6 [Coccinella septempunctata]|uniref:probable inactive peptidyl-prolyl cis-trans isomerase-like 6 n=1 Tax=Coccinella septempunctata TaxID=41139 RepID=UPI001D05E761|nr:probable inactive peptidyl-prolyl cis-trans isomerase-like 6 [Coccinella septempunctata]